MPSTTHQLARTRTHHHIKASSHTSWNPFHRLPSVSHGPRPHTIASLRQFATIRQFQALATIGYGPAKDSERTDAYWLVRSLIPSPRLPSLRIKFRNNSIDLLILQRNIKFMQ
jgi:hypothetical protein